MSFSLFFRMNSSLAQSMWYERIGRENIHITISHWHSPTGSSFFFKRLTSMKYEKNIHIHFDMSTRFFFLLRAYHERTATDWFEYCIHRMSKLLAVLTKSFKWKQNENMLNEEEDSCKYMFSFLLKRKALPNFLLSRFVDVLSLEIGLVDCCTWIWFIMLSNFSFAILKSVRKHPWIFGRFSFFCHMRHWKYLIKSKYCCCYEWWWRQNRRRSYN